MIVVTGAAGQLGRGVIELLLKRMPANQIVASMRDTGKAAEFAKQGVHVREGDFGEPSTLERAFMGAHQVLVVSVNKVGGEALALHRAAIKAARHAGAQRVLYTSHMGARKGSMFVPAADHDATEAFLAESGSAFTSLHHGFYAESALHLIGDSFETGFIRLPEDGPVSWTSRDDLAEADAIVLANEGKLNGITPALTAPEAFTMEDLADIASELTGRTIKRVTISDDEYRDAKVAQGVPLPMAEMLLGMFKTARQGDFAAVDPTLETLLARRPKTMRDVLAALLKPS